MKRLLTLVTALIIMGFSTTAFAQCDLQNVVIDITGNSQVGADCHVNYNLSFRLKNNGGNKTVVIQAWKESEYPAFWGTTCTGNKSPKAADLRLNGTGELPILNIAFDIATQAVISSANYPSGGVTLGSGYTVQVGAVDALGYYPISLSNLTAVLPNQQCGTGVTLKADVWSSQASVTSQWTPHCIICNNTFAFNYPVISAQMNCLIPRGYFVRISNINTSQVIVSSWKAYRDVDADGVLSAADVLVDDQSGVQRTIQPGTAFTSGFIPYTGNDVAPTVNQNIIVEVTTQGLANNQYAVATNGCSTLPVDMKSFTATRSNDQVILKWETATEQQSASFAIERNTGLSGWQPIGRIGTRAPGGNSNVVLAYNFTDINAYKGVSQYRIRQIDVDGKSRYSEIRSVRADGQASKVLVYPNPSNDGKVTVVLDDRTNTQREITLVDMSGRVIRQLKSVSSNTIQFENLTSGFYSLRILSIETGDQSIQKIVVNRK